MKRKYEGDSAVGLVVSCYTVSTFEDHVVELCYIEGLVLIL